MRKIKRIAWIVGFFVLCAALLIFGHLSTDNIDFSRYNTGWNGTSQFFDRAGDAIIVIKDSESLAEYRNASLIVIAPSGNYSAREISLYRAFIENGNTLVLLDDFGTGNQLLEGIGSSIRMPGVPLASADHAYENVSLVRVYPTGNSSFVAMITSLVLDRPATVEGGEPFLVSSLLTWGDINGDSKVNSGETLGQYTVGASEKIGNGEIIAIGDPSILINGMAAVDPGRDLFIDGFLELEPLTMVELAHSRAAGQGSQGSIIHMIQTTTLIQTIVLIIIAAGIAISFRRGNH